MESLDHQSARDFSDVQLKPAPLRLARTSQSSIGAGQDGAPDSPPKHVRIDEAVTEITAHQKSTTQGQTLAGFYSPAPCAQTITPVLASLLSKFEMLDAVSAPRSKVFRRPLTVLLPRHRNGIRPRPSPMLKFPQPPTPFSQVQTSSPYPDLEPVAPTLGGSRRQHCRWRP